MPLMTKIRESLATFFSIFAGLFVVYIVLDWGMDITGRKHAKNMAESQEIGKINKRSVTTKEYAELVKRAIENQKAQAGTEPDDNQQRAIRDQIWQQLVEQTLYDEQIEKLGIKITDQEIIDWVRGDNPPEFLRRQFTDSTGTFNRQAYDGTIMDPKNKAIMVQVEDLLRKQREREKLQSIITASVQVSEIEIQQKFSDMNIKYEADYAYFDPNVMVDDKEINVTDDEMRRYYNEHSDDYKVDASRKLKYILFSDVPSRADSDDVQSEMEDILKRAKAGVEFDTLAKMYSETSSPGSYNPHGTIGFEIENALFSSKKGDIIGPVKEADGYHLMKVADFRQGKVEYIRASHILIKIENSDSGKALNEAKSILKTIREGGNFADLAAKYSGDPGSAIRGGDLGWFTKGRMVKPFDEAAFKAQPGQVVGPVKSDFGYHIIKVVGRDKQEVKYSDIKMSVHVSSRTRSDIAQRAQDFAYLAKETSFEKEAEQGHYTVSETPSFQKDAAIPGIGLAPAVSKFANKGKVGAVSEALSINNGYGVFLVTEIKEAGIRPFDEVKAALGNRLKREKKIEKIKSLADELRKSINPADSLRAITTKNPKISVQHLAPFSLSGYIPGIGRDLNFTGGLSSLSVGQLSNPIESPRGIYLIKLLSKSPFDTTMFATQKPGLRTQMLSEKRNRFFTDWSEQLKKAAEITDNREVFYR